MFVVSGSTKVIVYNVMALFKVETSVDRERIKIEMSKKIEIVLSIVPAIKERAPGPWRTPVKVVAVHPC